MDEDPASPNADASGDSSEFEFQELRSQNDLRLKSTFEAIFEKYGKDFTGIGDEIDLETGEIVVNNGHLSEMRDEQDVGQDAREDMGRFLRALTEPLGQGYGNGDPNIDTEGHEEEIFGTEDWDEDEELMSDGSEDVTGRCYTEPRGTRKRRASALEQFGGELDRQTSQYAIQPNPIDDSQVEPAWQAPGPALPTPGTRPILRSVLDSKRAISTSPIEQGSLWAPPKRRGRQKAIPFEFFHDVLKHPRVTKRQRRLELTSPILISDDEIGQEDQVAPSAGNKNQSLSGNRIESTPAIDSMQSPMRDHLPQDPDYRPTEILTPGDLTDSYKPRNTHQQPPKKWDWGSGSYQPLRSTPIQSLSKVICSISPMKNGEAQLYEALECPRSTAEENMDNNTELETVLESFRRRLGIQRQNRRDRTLNELPSDMTSNNTTEIATLKEGGYPSLNQLARDLFFAGPELITVDEPPQDRHQFPEITEDNYDMDDYHVDDSGSGSLWESESELQSKLVNESESELGSEPESKRTQRRQDAPQNQAKTAARARGSSSNQRPNGGRFGTNKKLKEGGSSSDRRSKKLSTAAPHQNAPLNKPKVPFALTNLPPGKKFIVSLEDDGSRPEYPYYLLCGTAILFSPDRKLTFNQIQCWLRERFEFFRKTEGWHRAAGACMKPKYGFALMDKYQPPVSNRAVRRAYYWTILPEFVHLYMDGGRVRRRRWRRKFSEVEPIDHSPNQPHTPARQANRQPVSYSTPISSLLKPTEAAAEESRHSQAIQSNQTMHKWKADILEFSDSESVAEGPGSNQDIRGRGSEAATEGSHSNRADILEPNDTETIPEEPQSNKTMQTLNAEIATEGLRSTPITQKQNEDILEFSNAD